MGMSLMLLPVDLLPQLGLRRSLAIARLPNLLPLLTNVHRVRAGAGGLAKQRASCVVPRFRFVDDGADCPTAIGDRGPGSVSRPQLRRHLREPRATPGPGQSGQ